MKPEQFHVPNALFVERSLHKDGPSPLYVAWKPHTSRMFYNKASLLKFCAWPKSLPTGQAYVIGLIPLMINHPFQSNLITHKAMLVLCLHSKRPHH